MNWSEVCGWEASCDRAGRLRRVKETGSTVVPSLLLAGDSLSCMPAHRLCPGTVLPCHGIGLAAHLQLISVHDHQSSGFPGPTMSVSTIRATEVSWCLFKHQGWSLHLQQNVPPLCWPPMLLRTGREDLGGLSGQLWPRHVVTPFPNSIRALCSPVCSKARCPCPGPGPPHCLLFPGLCVRLFCHLSVAAAARS